VKGHGSESSDTGLEGGSRCEGGGRCQKLVGTSGIARRVRRGRDEGDVMKLR
jgi:hypothetical protein